MNLVEMKPNVFAVDAPGTSANMFFFRTNEGVIWVDTGMGTHEVQPALDAAGLTADDVTLLINTHADIDHISGNKLFSCPIMAHELTRQRMIAAGIAEKELPTITFSGSHKKLEIGGISIDLYHKGGHKEDQLILWVQEQKVLFPSDLVFADSFPFMMNCDVPVWIAALKELAVFEAEAILPGHGPLCGYDKIEAQTEYMETMWHMIGKHVAQGHTLEETKADPDLPHPMDWERQNHFEVNIEVMYQQYKEKR